MSDCYFLVLLSWPAKEAVAGKGHEQQQLRRANKTKLRGTGARERLSFPSGTPKAGDNVGKALAAGYFHNDLSVEAQLQIL